MMSMSNWIVKHDPLHIIKLFSGKLYYFKSSNLPIIETAIESKKFIKIRDDLINVSSIENIYPATNDINQVESKLIELSKEKADKIRTQVYLRKENNPHKTLNDVVLDNIIKSV